MHFSTIKIFLIPFFRVMEITQCDPNRIRFFNCDLCDEQSLEEIFKNSGKFSSCIHFAGLKAVGESVQKPLLYYENNLGSTISLLKMMVCIFLVQIKNRKTNLW